MASTILMVQPDNFGYNEETASSNSFQKKSDVKNVSNLAMNEFNEAVKKLKSKGINVITFPSPKNSVCPDAVFPNNWFSTHPNGTLILYPMLTPNRRLERNPEIIQYLKNNFKISNIIDITENEKNNLILEGTGSIVFDHQSKFAFACISPRTNEILLNDVCNKLHYTPVVFEALDIHGNQIYHTNVVMAIAKKYIIICLECVENSMEQSMLKQIIAKTGKKLIEISREQMNHFAGNMLEVQNAARKSVLVMSQTAFQSLNENQKSEINLHSEILTLDINTIETIGGGSARCMMAEIYPDPKIP